MAEESADHARNFLQVINQWELVESSLRDVAARHDPEDLALLFGVLNKLEVNLAASLAFQVFEGFEPYVGEIWKSEMRELDPRGNTWRIVIAALGAARDDVAFEVLWKQFESTHYSRHVAEALARYVELVNDIFYDSTKAPRLEARRAALEIWTEYLKFKQREASETVLNQIEPVVQNMAENDKSQPVREYAQALCEQIAEVRAERNGAL